MRSLQPHMNCPPTNPLACGCELAGQLRYPAGMAGPQSPFHRIFMPPSVVLSSACRSSLTAALRRNLRRKRPSTRTKDTNTNTNNTPSVQGRPEAQTAVALALPAVKGVPCAGADKGGAGTAGPGAAGRGRRDRRKGPGGGCGGGAGRGGRAGSGAGQGDENVRERRERERRDVMSRCHAAEDGWGLGGTLGSDASPVILLRECVGLSLEIACCLW